ncbi:integrase arm-type DNA-binding domain-containing protein [Acetobacteraceae bacterium KSS8]|uniref:Integrase arm-type DNA-binding domain-containing protein n=1 Tax=Endosaccharibacter trunci TaxID=2812733 RepID=A0ABT1WAL9_9PROT|nr:integrase arm-type DNA-binding domain-containing protein [Acetobacteraceae bacterium KSS8]
MRLGKREIDALTCPPGRRDVLVMDADLTGFGLRVSESGVKTFLFQYRYAGQVRRMRLGTYGDLTPAQARRLAEEARGRVAAGGDPLGERQAQANAFQTAEKARRSSAKADHLTLRKLTEAWRATGLSDRSEAHRREAPRAILTALPKLLDVPAHLLDPAVLQARLDHIGRTRPVTARRLRDYGRAMFGWAVKRRLLAANPFAALVVDSREVSRDRVLSDVELGEAWRASAAMAPPFGPLFQLLILTLQRRAEVAGLRWDEISPDGASWTVPAARSKNGKAHVVHLPPIARAVIASIIPFVDPLTGRASPFVFTTNGRTAVSGFQNAKERLDRAIHAERQEATACLPPGSQVVAGDGVSTSLGWRLHDLRRTGVTALARLGVAPHVADRLLNHVQGTIRGVAAVYQRHEFMPEREAASALWAQHVLAVGGPVAPVVGGEPR